MDARTVAMTNLADDDQRGGVYQRSLDVTRIRAILQRRYKLALAVGLIVFGLITLFTLQITPKYSATASVMLDQHQQRVLNVNVQEVNPDLTPDSATVDTEVQVLQSHTLARKVVDALNLQSDPEFNGRLRPHRFFGPKTPQPAPTTPAAIAVEKDHVASAVLGGLKVVRQGTTFVINISYLSASPQKAAAIANAFADLYLTDQLEAKFEATRRASDWLDSHLAGLRSQAEAADAAVEQYKSANGLLSSEGNTLTEQSISGLNGEIASARAAQAEAEARVNTARSQLAHGSTGEDVGEALSSTVVQQLRAQRAEVSREVADMSGRYGSRHPDLLKAQRQLSDIDSQISAEVTRIISNLEAQASVARQRTASLEGSLANSRGTLSANNSASVKLNELQRNADSVKALYQSFLDRFKQTTAQQGIEQSDARILTRAQVPPKPAFPNVPLNILLGLCVGGACGLGAVLVAEMLEQGISSTEDIEALLGVNALAAIPLLSSIVEGKNRSVSPTIFLVEKPLSRFAEAFRTLRTAVLYADVDRRVQVVAVASSVPGEGKTTTCVGLARTAALAGSRVVIIDCDIRRRSVHKLFDVDLKKGLVELLSGEATLQEVLITDPATGASLIGLSDAPVSARDVFGSDAMEHLLTELRGMYDMIFLDTAPILAVADSAVVASKADTVVFLTRWRRTPRRLVRNSLKTLRAVGARVAGVALTQVDVREQARAGQGEAAYYYKQHSQYYSES